MATMKPGLKTCKPFSSLQGYGPLIPWGMDSHPRTALPAALDTFLQAPVVASHHGTGGVLCVWGLGIKPPALETVGFSSHFDPENQDVVCTDGG